MSLILDALRKLEREKGAPKDRGFVVLGAGGGGGRRPTGRAVLAALAAVAVGALLGVAWHRLAAPSPGPVTEEETAAPPPGPTLEAVSVPDAPREPAPPPPSAPAPVATAPEAAAVAPEPAPTPELRLQAITRRDGRPVALLNDRLVREGDSFDGIRVVRIGELEVELETPGGNVTLRF